MNNKANIFVERGDRDRGEEVEEEIITLDKNEIMKSIPDDALTEPNEILGQTCTEWRWRIFVIPGKENEVIEISFRKPRGERMFMNNRGKWVSAKVGNEFDKFVMKKYYAYGS